MRRCIAMKLVGVLAGVSILVIGGVAEADYIIRFRDRKDVVVRNYTETGQEIKYWHNGEMVSVPKASITVIVNTETGEKLVLKAYYSKQEAEELRKAQAKELEAITRRQQARDRARRQPEPQTVKEEPKGTKDELPSDISKEEREEQEEREKLRKQGLGCGFTGHSKCANMATCIATGYGAFGSSGNWYRISPEERVRKCEAGESMQDVGSVWR